MTKTSRLGMSVAEWLRNSIRRSGPNRLSSKGDTKRLADLLDDQDLHEIDITSLNYSLIQSGK